MLKRLLFLKACRKLFPVVAVAAVVTTSFSYGQNIPTANTKSIKFLRGQPLAQRPGVTTLAVPTGTTTVNGVTTTTFFSTGIPAKVPLYPQHNNIFALDNGTLQPGFVYSILPPSALGGGSIGGGIGGGIGGIGGGIGGIGGGISGGIGGIGGGISGGIGGIGGIGGGISGGIGGIGGISGGIGGIGGGVGGFGGFSYPLGNNATGNSFQGGMNPTALGSAATSQQTGFGGFGGGFGGVLGALGGRGY
jgi:hypothetical protein